MSSERHGKLRAFRPVLLLSLLMLGVVSGASYLIFQQGAHSLREKADEHILHEVTNAKVSIEQATLTLVEGMESLAAQPVMVRILDEDADLEIAQLVDTIAEHLEFMSELSCVTAGGKVLASTNAARVATRVPVEALEEFRRGRRAAVEWRGMKVRVTVPIFWKFDEREFLGVLQATVTPGLLLARESDWWVGLASPSGEVIEQRGPALPQQLDLNSRDEVYPDVGRVIKRTALVEFPPGVRGPEWYVVVAEKHEALFGQIDVLKRISIWMAVGAWGVIVFLVVMHTRQLQALTNSLAKHARGLEQTTAALRVENIERKLAERKLEERTSYLNALIENSPLAIVVLDSRHRVQMCNPAFERLFLYSQAELISGDLDQLIASSEAAGEAMKLTQSVLAGELVHATTRRRRKDGTLLDVEVYGMPLVASGQLTGVYALYQDITERKRAEEELQRSAERFRQLLESLPVAIRVVQDGMVVFCNSADAALHGFEGTEEIIGVDAFLYFEEEDAQRLWEHAGRRAAGDPTVPNRYEAHVKRADGRVVPVEIVSARILYTGRPASLTALLDISERKRLQLYESILPVCSVCGKVRNDTGTERGKGSWQSLQTFVMEHSDTSLSHTFCPGCYHEYRRQQGLPPEPA